MNTIPVKVGTMGYCFHVEPDGKVANTDIRLGSFCEFLIDWEFDNKQGRWIPKTAYRYYNEETHELWLPKFTLEKFREFIKLAGGRLEETTIPLVEGLKVDIPIIPNFKPKDERQADCIEYLTTHQDHVRGLELQTGGGKAQPLTANIKIPGGWDKMGNLKVGSPIIAPDGTVTYVTGIFPQGKIKAYKLIFEDGRETIASGDHLWKSFYVNTSPHRRWKIRTTDEMKRLIAMPNPRVYIPLIEPEQQDDVELPFDPYLLGYMLGNGSILNKTPRLSTKDPEIVKRFSDAMPSTMYLESGDSKYDYYAKNHPDLAPTEPNAWTEIFKQLGIHGKDAITKFIPDVFMNASPRQKLEVLKGLMDSDGTVDTKSTCSFASASVVLADQLIELVRSLGGIAHRTVRYPFYNYKNERHEGLPSYRVNIKVKKPSKLFWLKRKVERCNDNGQYASVLKLKLKAIVEVEDCEMQCISVAHDERLYVTDDYIATHNTAASIVSAAKLGRRTMICVPGFVDQWYNAIKQYTLLEDKDIFIVKGGPSFQKLMARIDKSLFPKIILCSIQTLRSYANGGESYCMFPPFEDLCAYLKVGTRIVDEGHLNFHANLCIDLRMNPVNTIVLTATFETGNDNVREIFDAHYPVAMRFGGDIYKRYVNVRMFGYRMPLGERRMPAGVYRNVMGYNHAKLEMWLLTKAPEVLDRVIERVYIPILQSTFFNIHAEGEKLLILCSTVAMCEYVADKLKKRFQQYKTEVFVAETEDDALMKADIVVSTPKSAGTGRDIPGLRSMLVTVSVRSSPLNKQMKGRLRELKSGNTPEYAMAYCMDIPPQVKHAEFRETILRPLALNYTHHTL